jgi:hypothetical protein
MFSFSNDRRRQRSTGKADDEIVAHELAHGIARIDHAGIMMLQQHHIVELKEAGISRRIPSKDMQVGQLGGFVL